MVTLPIPKILIKLKLRAKLEHVHNQDLDQSVIKKKLKSPGKLKTWRLRIVSFMAKSHMKKFICSCAS